MRLFSFFALLLSASSLFAQDNKSAEEYYQIAENLEKDPELKKKGGGRVFFESLPFYLKASEKAKPKSKIYFKSAYKSAYLYNYAPEVDKSGIDKRIIECTRQFQGTELEGELVADIYFRAGIAYGRKYDGDSAIICFRKAQNGYTRFYGEQSAKVAECLHAEGQIEMSTFGNFLRAESLFEKALNIRENLEKDFLNNYMISIIYSNLMNVNTKQRDFEKAKFFEQKHLEFLQFNYENIKVYRGIASEELGEVFLNKGQYDKSIEFFNKAIELNKASNGSRLNSGLAMMYIGLSKVFRKKGDSELSMKYAQIALSIFEATIGERTPKYAQSLLYISEITNNDHIKLSSLLKAKKLITEFSLGRSGLSSDINCSIGDYYYEHEKLDSSLFYFQEALISSTKSFVSKDRDSNPMFSQILLKDYAFKAALGKAKVYHKKYNEKEPIISMALKALQCYQLAEQLLADERGEMDVDQSRWKFYDSNFGLYESALSLLWDMQKRDSALPDSLIGKTFAYMESSKTKLLTDELNLAEFIKPLGGDSLVRSLNGQRKKLHYLTSLTQNLDEHVVVDQRQQQEMKNSLIDVERQLQITEQKVTEKYPSYLLLKYKYHAPSISSVQNVLHDRECLIEYFFGDSSVFAIAVTRNDVQFIKINSVNKLVKNIQSVLTHLKNEKSSYRQEDVSKFSELTNSLYGQLVQPFNDIIGGSTKLIIIPDGILGQLPFEVLTQPIDSNKLNFRSLNYLVKKYYISYSFSSSYLMKKLNNGINDPSLLAFGFTGNSELRTSERRNSTLREIQGTEDELLLLKGKFDNGTFYFGEDVTEQRFKELAPQYELIHLAVHGKGDTEQDYSANLQFRDSLTSEDGLLHWFELFDIPLKAKLAVISSCESGIGKVYRGEGMLSMASAFAFAGCDNIVMGLWKVNDNVSVKLMDSFYSNIINANAVDEALTDAKREYLNQADELTADPRLWASLVAYGNDEIIEESVVRNPIFILGSLGAIIFALLVALKKKRNR